MLFATMLGVLDTGTCKGKYCVIEHNCYKEQDLIESRLLIEYQTLSFSFLRKKHPFSQKCYCVPSVVKVLFSNFPADDTYIPSGKKLCEDIINPKWFNH